MTWNSTLSLFVRFSHFVIMTTNLRIYSHNVAEMTPDTTFHSRPLSTGSSWRPKTGKRLGFWYQMKVKVTLRLGLGVVVVTLTSSADSCVGFITVERGMEMDVKGAWKIQEFKFCWGYIIIILFQSMSFNFFQSFIFLPPPPMGISGLFGLLCLALYSWSHTFTYADLPLLCHTWF